MQLHLKPTDALSYISIYMALCSTDSHLSISLKVQEGNVIWHKTIKNDKISSYHSIYENAYKLHNIFLVRVFWLKYYFRIKLKIPILDLMLSYDVAPRNEITPCNKICKPLVVYRFLGHVMTSITSLCT